MPKSSRMLKLEAARIPGVHVHPNPIKLKPPKLKLGKRFSLATPVSSLDPLIAADNNKTLSKAPDPGDEETKIRARDHGALHSSVSQKQFVSGSSSDDTNCF